MSPEGRPFNPPRGPREGPFRSKVWINPTIQKSSTGANPIRSPPSRRHSNPLSRSDPSFGRLSPPPSYSQVETAPDWKPPAIFANPGGDLNKKSGDAPPWKGPNKDGNLNGIKIGHAGEPHTNGNEYPAQQLQVNTHIPIPDSDDINAQIQQLNPMLDSGLSTALTNTSPAHAEVNGLNTLDETPHPSSRASSCFSPMSMSSGGTPSSIIRRSSGSKCAICKSPDAPVINPLIKCTGCSLGYHPSCHKPKLSVIGVASDWKCFRCKPPVSSRTGTNLESAPNTMPPPLTEGGLLENMNSAIPASTVNGTPSPNSVDGIADALNLHPSDLLPIDPNGVTPVTTSFPLTSANLTKCEECGDPINNPIGFKPLEFCKQCSEKRLKPVEIQSNGGLIRKRALNHSAWSSPRPSTIPDSQPSPISTTSFYTPKPQAKPWPAPQSSGPISEQDETDRGEPPAKRHRTAQELIAERYGYKLVSNTSQSALSVKSERIISSVVQEKKHKPVPIKEEGVDKSRDQKRLFGPFPGTMARKTALSSSISKERGPVDTDDGREKRREKKRNQAGTPEPGPSKPRKRLVKKADYDQENSLPTPTSVTNSRNGSISIPQSPSAPGLNFPVRKGAPLGLANTAKHKYPRKNGHELSPRKPDTGPTQVRPAAVRKSANATQATIPTASSSHKQRKPALKIGTRPVRAPTDSTSDEDLEGAEDTSYNLMDPNSLKQCAINQSRRAMDLEKQNAELLAELEKLKMSKPAKDLTPSSSDNALVADHTIREKEAKIRELEKKLKKADYDKEAMELFMRDRMRATGHKETVAAVTAPPSLFNSKPPIHLQAPTDGAIDIETQKPLDESTKKSEYPAPMTAPKPGQPGWQGHFYETISALSFIHESPFLPDDPPETSDETSDETSEKPHPKPITNRYGWRKPSARHPWCSDDRKLKLHAHREKFFRRPAHLVGVVHELIASSSTSTLSAYTSTTPEEGGVETPQPNMGPRMPQEKTPTNGERMNVSVKAGKKGEPWRLKGVGKEMLWEDFASLPDQMVPVVKDMQFGFRVGQIDPRTRLLSRKTQFHPYMSRAR